MHYTLNEEYGKVQGMIIDLRGDTLEDAIHATFPGAVIGTIYDRPHGNGKTFTVREWDKSYFDGRYLRGKIVFIPRTDLDQHEREIGRNGDRAAGDGEETV